MTFIKMVKTISFDRKYFILLTQITSIIDIFKEENEVIDLLVIMS